MAKEPPDALQCPLALRQHEPGPLIPAMTPKAAYRFFITDLIIVVSHMIYPGLLASRVFGGFIFTWASILLLFISAAYILISFLKSRKIRQNHKN